MRRKCRFRRSVLLTAISLNFPETEEINFSNVNKYEGLTYIKTDVNDTSKTAPDFLSFDIDEDATIYVAYEKLDHLFAIFLAL